MDDGHLNQKQELQVQASPRAELILSAVHRPPASVFIHNDRDNH